MKVIGTAWLTIAVLSVGFAASPALADEHDQVRRLVVNFGDLDLSAAAGASALYERLKVAAWRVCDKPEGGFWDQAGWLLCYQETLARAVHDVGNTKVTALYDGEHNVRSPSAAVTANSTKSTGGPKAADRYDPALRYSPTPARHGGP